MLYAAHRWVTLWRWWRGRSRSGSPAAVSAPLLADDDLPIVTVQLPVYNERRVIERLIDAAAALDYPRERLEIQVLDDSTDDTTARAAAAVARQRARGLDIAHLRRGSRAGYKAGALAWGMERARGELIAVFDADFVPRPDFLRRMVRHFADPRVGMAQARWTHLNRDQSRLTAAQAVMLDSHFLLEHEARASNGLFFNFNGAAGVWRKSCIDSAGGWRNDTLTEDLDLSYRAQLAGWRFAFDASIEAPAELPAEVSAFQSQQRRWAKGSIQTARKVLPALLRARIPLRMKLEAWMHLTANAAYPLLLALALLLPALIGRSVLPARLAWALQITVIPLGVLPVVLFLALGQRVAGRRPGAIARDVLTTLVLGAGLSVNNARAVLEGFGPRLGKWERTPKRGDVDAPRDAALYRRAAGVGGRTELALGAYFFAAAGFAARARCDGAIPFALMLAAGFAAVGWGSWCESALGTAAPGRATAG